DGLNVLRVRKIAVEVPVGKAFLQGHIADKPKTASTIVRGVVYHAETKVEHAEEWPRVTIRQRPANAVRSEIRARESLHLPAPVADQEESVSQVVSTVAVESDAVRPLPRDWEGWRATG